MTRKERLMASLQKKAVDRPPISFYELNGLDEDPSDTDPFNIYSDPSWLPLIRLTAEKTDRIVMRTPKFVYGADDADPMDTIRTVSTAFTADSREISTLIRAKTASGVRLLTERTKRQRDVNTVWVTEHLLKDEDDLKAWIGLPEREEIGTFQPAEILAAEAALGDSGIVMIDIADALCEVAGLFSMEDFTIIAMTQNSLFHAALEKIQKRLLRKVESVSEACPGRLWRIYGPEYASVPYLPPRLYDEYVVRYDSQLIKVIHRSGGYARIHQHGNIRSLLHLTERTGCIGIDPIEPPPQGDVSLAYVRENFGDRFVLFGNLEIADIEQMRSDIFAAKVKTALEEGPDSRGTGFVLMPSACPYGRKLSPIALENYCKMIELVESYRS